MVMQGKNSQDLSDFVKKVEKELLFHMYQNINFNKITPEQAGKLAKEFLFLLPAKDKQDLLLKLNVLGKTYPEAQQTYTDELVSSEEQKRQEKLAVMRDHIKSGNIEAAIVVAKGN
jgi:hypothetical protein